MKQEQTLWFIIQNPLWKTNKKGKKCGVYQNFWSVPHYPWQHIAHHAKGPSSKSSCSVLLKTGWLQTNRLHIMSHCLGGLCLCVCVYQWLQCELRCHHGSMAVMRGLTSALAGRWTVKWFAERIWLLQCFSAASNHIKSDYRAGMFVWMCVFHSQVYNVSWSQSSPNKAVVSLHLFYVFFEA